MNNINLFDEISQFKEFAKEKIIENSQLKNLESDKKNNPFISSFANRIPKINYSFAKLIPEKFFNSPFTSSDPISSSTELHKINTFKAFSNTTLKIEKIIDDLDPTVPLNESETEWMSKCKKKLNSTLKTLKLFEEFAPQDQKEESLNAQLKLSQMINKLELFEIIQLSIDPSISIHEIFFDILALYHHLPLLPPPKTANIIHDLKIKKESFYNTPEKIAKISVNVIHLEEISRDFSEAYLHCHSLDVRIEILNVYLNSLTKLLVENGHQGSADEIMDATVFAMVEWVSVETVAQILEDLEPLLPYSEFRKLSSIKQNSVTVIYLSLKHIFDLEEENDSHEVVSNNNEDLRMSRVDNYLYKFTKYLSPPSIIGKLFPWQK